ncbi:OsmC family protein [Rhodopila sp.]|uniref:OsmC family protein n=1 Tax=Rhodopila sp. TaxID=2480087 RepID=UPI002C43C2FD|nr:OsmC family protein [Rhodopila sp.]HVZ07962.1 OsmC family protein [Rhodopila sp.]
MAGRTHTYHTHLAWTGAAAGLPFRNHRRDYRITAPGKPPLEGSCDPVFRGDPSRWNPEDLLVASLSACHQLWYLGLCAAAGIEVLAYEDVAEGTMVEESAGGAGQFAAVVLRPRVTVANEADIPRAMALHKDAHDRCFIARSVNFPVSHEPQVCVG